MSRTDCYLVTKGCYSDYTVVAVFLDEEEAESYRRDLEETGEDVNDVETVPLGRPDDKVPTRCWYARIDCATGAIRPPRPYDREYKMAPPGARSDTCVVQAWQPSIRRISYVSQDHANKLAVESRQRWLALQDPLREVKPDA